MRLAGGALPLTLRNFRMLHQLEEVISAYTYNIHTQECKLPLPLSLSHPDNKPFLNKIKSMRSRILSFTLNRIHTPSIDSITITA